MKKPARCPQTKRPARGDSAKKGSERSQRQKAEAALASSEGKFCAAFDFSPVPITIVDLATGLIVDLNKTCLSFFGISREELIGHASRDTVSWGWVDPAAAARFYETLEASGQVRDFPAELRIKNGQIRTVLLSTNTIEVEGKRYAINQARDVTDTLRIQKELASSEKKFSLAFNASPDAFAITDPETALVVDVNEAFTDWSGYSRQELLGKSTKTLGLWAEPGKRDEIIAQLRSGVNSVKTTSLAKVKDGSLRHVIFSASLVQVEGKSLMLSLTHDITDMMRLDQERQLSISLLKATLESTTDGILVVDLERNVRSHNKRYLQIWNIPDALFSEKRDARLLEFAVTRLVDPEAFTARVHELYSQPAAESFDTIKFKDGRIIERYSQPQRLDGRIVGRVWSFRDVTARVLAEQAQRLGEQRLANAGRLAHFGAWEGEISEGRFREMQLRWSDEVYRICGYEPGQVPATNEVFFNLVHPEDRETVREATARAVANREPYSVEHRIIRPDGLVRWIQEHADIKFDEQGRPLRFIGSFQDITERKEAEAALRESEGRFRQVIAKAPLAMAIMGLDGTIEYVNQKAVEVFGYQPEDIPDMERWWVQAYPDEDYRKEAIADWSGRVRRALEHGGEIAGNEYRVTCKDRTVKVMFVWGVPVANKIFVLFNDITERARLLQAEKTARSEAETANKAKDDFLAIVSHELRTPLTAILGWTWLLRSGQLAEQESHNALDIIVRNMQNQRQIVEDLIDVSSLSRGQFGLAKDTFDLSAVLESVCASLSQTARDRGVTLVRELAGPVGVLGDSGRLQQVFWNLLHNAMKFSPDGGKVQVSLRRQAEQAVIEVEDSGKGIQPEFLPHVFEPFRQGEDPMIREHRGLGLGLAIVKRIVELHGGSVCAASAGQGRGALFTVTLPAVVWPPPGRATEPQVSLGARCLDGLAVLVVEDESDNRQMLQQLLSRYGARVTLAQDAAEAWVSLERSVPDLMLCDIAMPGEDGCSFIRKVRSRGGRMGELPAAALTALARDEYRARAIAAGFQTYLTKPMEPLRIVEAVRVLAGRR